jgi:ligand-binding sensor domain-containing protein
MRLAIAALSIGLVSAAIPFEPSLRDYVHTEWTHQDGVPLASVDSITQTTDGYLWLKSEGGLLRFDGARFVPEPTPCEEFNNTHADGAGGLWIFCDYRVFHRDASGRTAAVPQNIYPLNRTPVVNFFVDSRGRVWCSQLAKSTWNRMHSLHLSPAIEHSFPNWVMAS